MARANQKPGIVNPKVSIIIPHHGGYTILHECISSIQNSDFKDYEVILVDNNTTDSSIEKVTKEFEDIRVLHLDTNKGYAGGCNEGANAANGEFLIFLNNDTVHESGWIQPLLECLIRNKHIGSVQPKIKNTDNRSMFDYAGASGGFIDIFCYPFTRGRIFNHIEQDINQYDNESKIFWASGCAFMTRRELFMKIKFDEKLFAYMEEIDFHWKLNLMGLDSVVIPQSVVYHSGETLEDSGYKKTYYNHRNSMILFLTNHNLFLMLGLLVPKLFLELISMTRYLITLNVRAFTAQLSTYFWISMHPLYLLKKSRGLSKLKTKSKFSIISKMYKPSIVLDYFIFRKRKYSDLVN